MNKGPTNKSQWSGVSEAPCDPDIPHAIRYPFYLIAFYSHSVPPLPVLRKSFDHYIGLSPINLSQTLKMIFLCLQCCLRCWSDVSKKENMFNLKTCLLARQCGWNINYWILIPQLPINIIINIKILHISIFNTIKQNDMSSSFKYFMPSEEND